ncbi:MAG: hypothetical protein ACK4GC_13340, partial [Paracoccaceae bacterium]
VAYYALHHGLAKGALFLSVGLMAMSVTAPARRIVLALSGFVALSVAGLPLSGGALAKLAAKADLDDPLAVALTASSVTTMAVLGWFLIRLAAVEAKRPRPAPVWFGVLAGVALLTVAALVLPWALWTGHVPLAANYPFVWENLVEAGWPVLAGLLLVLCIAPLDLPGRMPLGKPHHHAGPATDDIKGSRTTPAANLAPAASLARATGRLTAHVPHRRAALRLLVRVKRGESRLLRWQTTGPALPVAGLVLALLIGLEM